MKNKLLISVVIIILILYSLNFVIGQELRTPEKKNDVIGSILELGFKSLLFVPTACVAGGQELIRITLVLPISKTTIRQEIRSNPYNLIIWWAWGGDYESAVDAAYAQFEIVDRKYPDKSAQWKAEKIQKFLITETTKKFMAKTSLDQVFTCKFKLRSDVDYTKIAGKMVRAIYGLKVFSYEAGFDEVKGNILLYSLPSEKSEGMNLQDYLINFHNKMQDYADMESWKIDNAVFRKIIRFSSGFFADLMGFYILDEMKNIDPYFRDENGEKQYFASDYIINQQILNQLQLFIIQNFYREDANIRPSQIFNFIRQRLEENYNSLTIQRAIWELEKVDGLLSVPARALTFNEGSEIYMKIGELKTYMMLDDKDLDELEVSSNNFIKYYLKAAIFKEIEELAQSIEVSKFSGLIKVGKNLEWDDYSTFYGDVKKYIGNDVPEEERTLPQQFWNDWSLNPPANYPCSGTGSAGCSSMELLWFYYDELMTDEILDQILKEGGIKSEDLKNKMNAIQRNISKKLYALIIQKNVYYYPTWLGMQAYIPHDVIMNIIDNGRNSQYYINTEDDWLLGGTEILPGRDLDIFLKWSDKYTKQQAMINELRRQISDYEILLQDDNFLDVGKGTIYAELDPLNIQLERELDKLENPDKGIKKGFGLAMGKLYSGPAIKFWGLVALKIKGEAVYGRGIARLKQKCKNIGDAVIDKVKKKLHDIWYVN